MRPFHLLQITDCHLGNQPNEELLGLNTDESLCDVLRLLQKQETPDLILTTGDISNDGGAESYNRFVDIIEKHFPGIPLAWLPGNHDDLDNMASVSPQPITLSHKQAGWHFIFLDSKVPREEGGDLSDQELARLEQLLSSDPKTPTIVFMHHQAIPVGSAWVDQYVIKSHEAFFKIIDNYSNVKAVSWGHVHQEFNGMRLGVPMLATPSTCVQFVPNRDDFEVDRIMPGYRRYVLRADGHFDTEVVRVFEKKYDINFAATGY